MSAIAFRKSRFLVFFITFFKKFFNWLGNVAQAIHELDEMETATYSEPHPASAVTNSQRKRRSDQWREYKPSRYVRWIVVHSGPNREQRREQARQYRLHIRYLERQMRRHDEQRMRRETSFAH